MRKILVFMICALFLTSCSKNFYQVYRVDSKVANKILYEDDNCEVRYDFWSEGGNVGFRFYNKTDESIYLLKDNSFFVLNGIAYDYFQNRTVTETVRLDKTRSASYAVNAGNSAAGLAGAAAVIAVLSVQQSKQSTVKTSEGTSVSYAEETVIRIPAHSAKVINEFDVSRAYFEDCELEMYPKKRGSRKSYSEENSPFVFSNRIVYSVGNTENPVRIENDFYVSEIANYSENDVSEFKEIKKCGKTYDRQRVFLIQTPDKFYRKYVKGAGFGSI